MNHTLPFLEKFAGVGIAMLLLASCNQQVEEPAQKAPSEPELYAVVLGIAQDAGYPQADCNKTCCAPFWAGNEETRLPTCLGIVDSRAGKCWIIEATPEFKYQLQSLKRNDNALSLAGIFLTHAHIGHYAGLINLGKEAIGGSKIPVHAMPRMGTFLRENGPWSQLVSEENIELLSLQSDSAIWLSDLLSITPILVPHRDEFSETVGFRITGPRKKILFIPDIDKWQKWDRNILKEIAAVDVALLDGTFYGNGELPNRNMADIPHPFIEESLSLFATLPAHEKAKIHFIHFNHTNPAMRHTPERLSVIQNGFMVSAEGMVVGL